MYLIYIFSIYILIIYLLLKIEYNLYTVKGIELYEIWKM